MKSLSREIAKQIALVTFAALVFVCSAPAQEMARVRGVLADQQGARVNGASVSLKNETFKRTIQSDQIGRFEFDVPPGKYKLSVASNGFDNVAGDVILNSGANEEFAIRLLPTPGTMCMLWVVVPEPGVTIPAVSIEVVHAPVFQKIAPMKLR